MSTLYVDTINEKTSGNGVAIPGHVVQVVNYKNTTQYSGTNQDVLTYLFQVALTPKQSNSKYLVHLGVSGISNGGSGRIHSRVYHNETSGDTSGTEIMSLQLAEPGAGTSHLDGAGGMVLVNSSGNTNTQYFKVCAVKGDSSTTWYISQYNSTCTITVMEIAQ